MSSYTEYETFLLPKHKHQQNSYTIGDPREGGQSFLHVVKWREFGFSLSMRTLRKMQPQML